MDRFKGGPFEGAKGVVSLSKHLKKVWALGTSLVVWWLRLHDHIAGDLVSVPGQETRWYN